MVWHDNVSQAVLHHLSCLLTWLPAPRAEITDGSALMREANFPVISQCLGQKPILFILSFEVFLPRGILGGRKILRLTEFAVKDF